MVHRTSIDWFKKRYNRKSFTKPDKMRELKGLTEGTKRYEDEDDEDVQGRIIALTELLAGDFSYPSELNTYYINEEVGKKLEVPVTIEGYTAIQALRDYYKSVGKDMIVEAKEGWTNTTVRQASVVYVNGVKEEYNAGHTNFRYYVREKNLFEKLADIHYKK